MIWDGILRDVTLRDVTLRDITLRDGILRVKTSRDVAAKIAATFTLRPAVVTGPCVTVIGNPLL